MNNISTEDILKIDGILAKGFGRIPKSVMLDTDLSIESKAIYAYFCSYAGSGTTSFPGRDKIINDLKISKDYYYKHLKILIEAGFITIEKKKTFPFNNTYTLINNPKKYKDTITTNADSQIRQSTLNSKGYGTIPKILMTDDRINLKAKAIYAYFCSYAGSGNVAFPLLENTLYYLKIGKDSYYKYYNQLIAYNYIVVVQRKTISGTFSVNDYYINETPDADAVIKIKNLKKHTSQPCTDLNDNGTILDNSTSQPCTDLPYNDTRDTELPYNDTKDNNINIFNINSIYNNQSFFQEKNEGLIDSKYKLSIFNEIWELKKLPYQYKDDYSKMTIAIHIMTDWDIFYPKGCENEFQQHIYELFNEALVSMCCCENMIKFSTFNVTYSTAIDKLNQKMKFGELDSKRKYIIIDEIQNVAICNYENIARISEIKNELKYMQSCIWTAMQTGDMKTYSTLAQNGYL